MFRIAAVLLFVLSLIQTGYAQNPTGNPGTAASVDDAISLKSLASNVLADQKRIYWGFPNQLMQGNHWVPVAGVLAATAAIIAADQFDTPYFRRTSTYRGFNNVFSARNTSLGILVAPLSLYGVGLLTHDRYAKNTALLTGEAVADAEILDEVLKITTRRARPRAIGPYGNFADTALDSSTITNGGFPSGHTIAAFSVATIMTDRYGRRHRWVPYVAYGLAATVGFSRVTGSAHFPSDVFVGAVLGYAVSHFAVLHSTKSARE